MAERPMDFRSDPETEAIEDTLRSALREPVPLPQGFAVQVLSRVAAASPFAVSRVAQAVPRFSWWAVAAMAALIAVLGTATGIRQGQRVKHMAAAQARQQLLLALHMTDLSLRSAEQRVDLQLAHSVAKTIQEAQ